MTIAYRIENSSGIGVWRSKDEDEYGDYIINEKMPNYLKFEILHLSELLPPKLDPLISRNIREDEFCACLYLGQFMDFFGGEWLEYFVSKGFRAYRLYLREAIRGKYQYIYKKENVLKQEDITDLLL